MISLKNNVKINNAIQKDTNAHSLYYGHGMTFKNVFSKAVENGVWEREHYLFMKLQHLCVLEEKRDGDGSTCTHWCIWISQEVQQTVAHWWDVEFFTSFTMIHQIPCVNSKALMLHRLIKWFGLTTWIQIITLIYNVSVDILYDWDMKAFSYCSNLCNK